MIICDKCGKENSDDRFICFDCGRELVNKPKDEKGEHDAQKDESQQRDNSRCSGGGYAEGYTQSDSQIKCGNCGKFTLAGSVYCSYCGKKMVSEQMRYCRFCGKQNSVGFEFCQQCGRSLNGNTVHNQHEKSGDNGNFKRAMIWAVGIICILLFLCIILVTCTVSNVIRRGYDGYRHYERKTVYTYYYPNDFNSK